MRYFLELAYNGAAYAGWQRQPNAPSVQQAIEEVLSLMLRVPIELTGCGRTDAGVHASRYLAHFDFEGGLPANLLYRANKLLPPDIVLYRMDPVADQAHARFDAFYRAYRYDLVLEKNPFRQQTATFLPVAARADRELVQQAAGLLLEFSEFAPFCKTGSDAKTMRCELYRSEWEFGPKEWHYHIAANRFLRGMVRLSVGMCINVGLGKLSLEEVRRALQEQSLLPKSQSAPPEGLFLTEIRYPDIP